MTDEALKTYTDWIRNGRYVRAGERANFYLVNDDDTEAVALFGFDQTEEHRETHVEQGWTRISPAAERPSKRRKESVKKIKLDYNAETKIVRVWVGANKQAISQLRGHGFMFDGRSHRWYAKRDNIAKTIAGIKSHNPDAAVEVTGV